MDFLYFQLVLKKGNESQEFPGAFLAGAPKGSNRHRSNNLLAILLSLDGEHRYSQAEIEDLLKSTSDVFFGAQGSVTRALQTACDQLNKLILERNLDRGYEGVRAAGAVNLAALHNDWLFVAQYGSTLTTLISNENFDEFGASEGQSEILGQSKHIQVRLYQSGIKPGDLILMNAHTPASWSSYYLAGSAALTMQQVKRRLLNQVAGDLEAIVIKCAEGAGMVIPGSWNDELVEKTAQNKSAENPSPLGREDGGIQNSNDIIENNNLSNQESFISEKADKPPVPEQQNFDDAEIVPGDDVVPVKVGETEKPDFSTGSEESSENFDRIANPALVRIARAWMNAKTFRAKLRQNFERTRKKLFPSYQQPQSALPPIISLFLVIAIPLVLILVSATVYTRTGKAEQYASYMEKAQNAASLAKEEKDALQQHTYWTQTLELVKEAENYNITRDSRLLFEQAQFLLDEMDLAARLDFRPALTQYFPDGVVISRIQASSSGVYLLDKTSGSILRIFLNSKGFYEIDDAFKCAPGPYGLEILTNLVDFVILQANDDNFRIMALDNQGNLLYCRPGELAVSRKMSAPENGWGRIIGVAYENDTLYVLDADKDTIWMYLGKDPNKLNIETASGIVFSEPPLKFLDEDIPDFGGAIDLAINQDDLFVLHADGHMTQCRYSADKEVRLTECKDPSPYTDNRVGQPEKNPWIFPDAKFTIADATRLPSSSIYLLNTADSSIYQFSYQLNLERVLRAQYNKNYPLPATPPSGFGITPESDLFLAFNNRLFIAPLK